MLITYYEDGYLLKGYMTVIDIDPLNSALICTDVFYHRVALVFLILLLVKKPNLRMCTPIVRHKQQLEVYFFIVKFSLEVKVKVVKKYSDEGDGVKRLAGSIKVHPSVLQQWIKQYNAVGEKRYRRYPLDYKLDVINYMDRQGTYIRETGAIFNIPSYGTVRRWKEAYDLKGVDSLHEKKRGRPTMKNTNTIEKLRSTFCLRLI
ncbi:Uncharacterized protein BC067498_02141 [Bacillus cereus]|nr:Uncharacterized protein BC067498_02141 [Bacillus cereus]